MFALFLLHLNEVFLFVANSQLKLQNPSGNILTSVKLRHAYAGRTLEDCVLKACKMKGWAVENEEVKNENNKWEMLKNTNLLKNVKINLFLFRIIPGFKFSFVFLFLIYRFWLKRFIKYSLLQIKKHEKLKFKLSSVLEWNTLLINIYSS